MTIEDYENLIKRLRYCADAVTCRFCPWRSDCCLREGQRKAADAIEELSRLYEAQRQNLISLMNEEPETEWITVKEKLPEEKDSGFSADVLILVKEQDGDFTWEDVYSGYYLYDAVSDETGWWAQMPQNCQQVKERFSVTHWMPLPEPPKEEIE